MKKPILLFLLILLFSCSKNVTDEKNLYDYVPQNTLAVVQVNDFNMVNNVLNNQALIAGLTALTPDLKTRIKAITPKNIESPALYCFTETGKAALGVSLIFRRNPKDSIQKEVWDTLLYNGFQIEKKRIDHTLIYKTKFQDIAYITDTQLILENSIRNSVKTSPAIQQNTFYTLSKNNDLDAPLNLLLHQNIERILEPLFPDTPLFPKTGNAWTAYDFNSKRDPFTLDGVTFMNDTLPDVLSLIYGQETKPMHIPRVIPQTFESFLTLSVSSLKTLEDNFKTYSRNKNIPVNKIDFDVFSAIDEIGWIAHKNTKANIFHVTNTDAINKTLMLPVNGKTFRGFTYYKGGLPKDMRLFLSAFGAEVHPKWVILIDDYLIFSEQEELLQTLIGSYLDGQNMDEDPNFLALKESLADNGTFLWVGHTKNLKSHWESLKKNTAKLKLDSELAEQYPLIAFQAVGQANLAQFRMTVQAKKEELSENTVLNQYNFNLEGNVALQPQWLKNHRNKTMDVAVQDTNNVLYLFSNTGTLFWKKQLPGKITGPIKQVDLYKNGRLQMAFRTEDRFMILDRNGKVVPPFDMKVSDEFPVQPLAVFDYERNRDYRFLLAQGKSLTMYDGKGKKVNGFKLRKLQYPLTRAPKHIRIGGKDFILLLQENGVIRFISRTGYDRIRPDQKINFSDNEIYSYLNKFSTTDIFGNLVQIDTKGKVTRTPKTLDEDHFIDMTSKTLVTLSENTLTIKGIPVTLPYGNYSRPKIFYINNIIFVSVTDLDTQKVYLYYSNATPVKGFPIYGSGQIDITNADGDSALEIVVQSENEELIIYQMNLE